MGVYVTTMVAPLRADLEPRWVPARMGLRLVWGAANSDGLLQSWEGRTCVQYKQSDWAKVYDPHTPSVRHRYAWWPQFIDPIVRRGGVPVAPLQKHTAAAELLAEACQRLAYTGCLRGPFKVGKSSGFSPQGNLATPISEVQKSSEWVKAVKETTNLFHHRIVAQGTPRASWWGCDDLFEAVLHLVPASIPLNINSAYGKTPAKRTVCDAGHVVFDSDSEAGSLGAHRLFCTLYGKRAPLPQDFAESKAAQILSEAWSAKLGIAASWG